MPDWEERILEQMDREAAEYHFPMLNNVYLRGADVRLTVYANVSEWLVVFQQIAVMEERDFVNVVSAYGNQISKPGTQQVVLVVEAPAGGRIRDENEHLSLDMWDFTIVIKGLVRHFAPTAKDYADAGVDIDDDAPASAKILRLLAAQIPEDLFLSDDQLLRICDRFEAGLNKFLQLEDWRHPDLADDELPSQSPCLRSLAHALSVNDPDLYECSANSFNTHWSIWEDMYGEM